MNGKDEETTEITEMVRKTSSLKRFAFLVPSFTALICIGSTGVIIEYYYPLMAEDKGGSQTLAGTVLGISRIGSFAGSLTSQFFIRKLSVKTTGIIAVIVVVICDSSIGVLLWCNNENIFFVTTTLMMLIRFYFNEWFEVSLLSALIERFSASLGNTISLNEIFWGTSFAIGVWCGGLIISVGHFSLPFFLFSAIMLTMLPFIVKNGMVHDKVGHNKMEITESVQCGVDGKLPSYYRLLLKPSFMLYLLTTMFLYVTVSFNGPTLERHLNDSFNLDTSHSGFIMMLFYATFSIGSPIAGAIYTKERALTILLTGQFAGVVAYAIQGPVPFIRIEPHLYYVVVSQILSGLSCTIQMTIGLAEAVREAIESGYPDDVHTSSMVTSWSFTLLMFNAVVIPIWAGGSVEHFGYQNASLFLLVPCVCWTIIMLIFSVAKTCHKKETITSKS